MALLASYYDAAGHNEGPHAVTVGGFIGDVRSWTRFSKRWRETLDRYGIDHFHMAAFAAGSAGFEKFRSQPALQAELLAELTTLVRRNVRFGMATTVLADDWESVNTEYRLKECRLTQYAIGAFSVMNKSILWIGRPGNHRNTFTEFAFEDGDAGRKDFEWLVDYVIQKSPEQLKGIRPVFYPKTVLPLQCADFAVWEQRWFVRRKLEGTLPAFQEDLRPSMQALLKIPNKWGVMDRYAIADWASRIGVPKRTDGEWRRGTWRPSLS